MKQTVEELRGKTIEQLRGIPSGVRETVANQILAIFLDQTKDDCPVCSWRKVKDYRVGCNHCNGSGKAGVWHPERLVVLANDQTLPANKYVCNMKVIGEPEVTRQIQAEIKREIAIYSEAQQDMLREGFHKVEVEK